MKKECSVEIKRQKGRRVLDEGYRIERISMALTETEIIDLDDWMFQQRIRTRSEAIRQLMRFGLLYSKQIK